MKQILVTKHFLSLGIVLLAASIAIEAASQQPRVVAIYKGFRQIRNELHPIEEQLQLLENGNAAYGKGRYRFYYFSNRRRAEENSSYSVRRIDGYRRDEYRIAFEGTYLRNWGEGIITVSGEEIEFNFRVQGTHEVFKFRTGKCKPFPNCSPLGRYD